MSAFGDDRNVRTDTRWGERRTLSAATRRNLVAADAP